jgi:signal transduction histidine kinase
VLVVVGAVLFAGIIAASILQTVWLVRQIRMGQRQRSFIDAVTHELYTPLASLRLYLETLQGGGGGEARRAEFLGIMAAELDRLERTVGHILQAARSEETRPRREPVELAPLLESCATDVRDRHELEEKAVCIDGAHGVHVRGNAEELGLAFRNLLENAVRCSVDHVRVDVKVRLPKRRWVEVEVVDQGVGIPASEWERIFERFQRLTPPSVRPRRGLGLGLHVVRSIVRQHKGSVRIVGPLPPSAPEGAGWLAESSSSRTRSTWPGVSVSTWRRRATRRRSSPPARGLFSACKSPERVPWICSSSM